MINYYNRAMIPAYDKTFNALTKGGFKLYFKVLDNNTSTAMKEKMTNLGIKFQLVSPGNHQEINLRE